MTARSSSQQQYYRGTIRYYNHTDELGLIVPDENQGIGELLLVHSMSFRRPMDRVEAGDRVIFATHRLPAGLQACDVHAEVVDTEPGGTGDEIVDGVISHYNPDRGFGFILLPDKRDAWFHISYLTQFVDEIKPGTPVTCSLVTTERGLQAQNVTIVRASVPYRSGTEFLPQAMLARDSRRYDEAAALYRRGMRESPSVQLILSFAAMEKNRRRNTEARRIYEDGIRLFPDIAKLREDAGVLAASQRDYQRAIVHLEEALAICRRTDQGGEKGVLLGLARTHYQIGSPSSLKESIRYYEQAQTLFGRGATRLPEADLLRLNLTRIRTQHHRGNLTYGFLSDAGFQVIKATLLDRVTEGADLIVEVHSPELQESYGIGRYLMVRCVFKSEVDLQDLEDLDSNIARWSRRGFADDQLALIIVASLPQELQRLLSQRIEDRRRLFPAIVPIQQSDIETAQGPMIALRASLDRWLYRRDLFAINSPVDGRRFFGRDRPLSELRDSIATSIPTGVFGLRGVEK